MSVSADAWNVVSASASTIMKWKKETERARRRAEQHRQPTQYIPARIRKVKAARVVLTPYPESDDDDGKVPADASLAAMSVSQEEEEQVLAGGKRVLCA